MVNVGTEFQTYFDEILRIWGKLSCTDKRIIPFCTPVVQNPKILVIGTNHSERFHPQLFGENKRIVDAFAREIQTEMHSYLQHNYPFARGLAKVVFHVQRHHPHFGITPQWVGTNRCAVETQSNGFATLKRIKGYSACEREMDALLQDFISFVKPEAVLLIGEYACGLYYDERKIDDMAITYLPFDNSSGDNSSGDNSSGDNSSGDNGSDDSDSSSHSAIIPLWDVSAKERTEHFRNKSATRLIKALNEKVITC